MGFCEKKFKNSFFPKKGVKTEDFQDDIQKTALSQVQKGCQFVYFFNREKGKVNVSLARLLTPMI